MSAATDQERVHARAALREIGERVAVAHERQERLLDAPLTLSPSECGRLRREPAELATTATEVLRTSTKYEFGAVISRRAESTDQCKQYGPGADATPAESAQPEYNAPQDAQRMRAQRVPDSPESRTGPSGGSRFGLNELGIDPNRPTFQAAQKACQGIMPGSK
jgi:hypothetical protein